MALSLIPAVGFSFPLWITLADRLESPVRDFACIRREYAANFPKN
jgi:hypothetical protein